MLLTHDAVWSRAGVTPAGLATRVVMSLHTGCADWTHTGTKLNQQGGRNHPHRTARKSFKLHLCAPRPVGSRPPLEGFGEAEERRHPKDTGGSNAGTKRFRARVGGAGLYS